MTIPQTDGDLLGEGTPWGRLSGSDLGADEQEKEVDGEQPCATQDPPAAPGVGWGWGVSRWEAAWAGRRGVCRGCEEEVRARWARFLRRAGVRTLHYLCDTGQEATWRHSRAATDRGGFVEGRGRGPEAKFRVL